MKKLFKIKTKDSGQDFINIEKTIKKFWKGSGIVNVAPFSKVFVVKPNDVTDIEALEKELTAMGYKIQRKGETRLISYKDSKTLDKTAMKDATPIEVESVPYKEDDVYVLEYTYNGRKMWIVTSTYKGEKTYTGGGTIEFTKSDAIQTAKNFATIHRLEKKYGTVEAHKRYVAGYKDNKLKDIKQNIDSASTKDSIMEEYEDFKNRLDKEKAKALDKYLNTHNNVSYSDILYKKAEYDKFENWYSKGMKDANIDKNKIEQIISSREFNFVKEDGNTQTYKFIGQNPYDKEYHYKELAKALPGNVGLALSGNILTVSYRDSAIKDGKYIINNMNDLKRLFTNFPKGDVEISYGRSGFYYNIRPQADGKVSLGSAGYDGTFNNLREALEWVAYDFRDLILNVNPDGSDRDCAVRDSNNYIIYKSGSDILGTNENNYNTRIQNAREIQNFSRQGFKNVEEVVEYVKKYFKVPGQIIVKDGGITERLEEANDLIRNSFKDSEPEFPAKGRWEYDSVMGDWYDTGAKMYYNELRKLNLMDSKNYKVKHKDKTYIVSAKSRKDAAIKVIKMVRK